MSDLERLLSDALHEKARGAVGDHAAPPAPRYAEMEVELAPTHDVRTRRRVWAPLAAAAAVVAVAGVVGAIAVAQDDGGPDPVAAPPPRSAESSPPSVPSAPTVTLDPRTGRRAVTMTTLNSDDATYGVGMPVVVYFSRTITDGRAFQAGTRVTADGTPLAASWYFQRSADASSPIEAQLRPKGYWPAHSRIHVEFPKAGTALGGASALSTKLTSLEFKIGAKRVATVDNDSHRLTLFSDGKRVADYPVSLGAGETRTSRGVKVVMEKGRSISMRGPGYYDPAVKDTQRLTNNGEYIHAAPWNTRNITRGVNSSNGCTNMTTPDAAALYDDLRVGDVVSYPNADGPAMTMGQGYGLWNVSWRQWQTGGLVPTR